MDVQKRAFVASQGYGASEFVPRRFIVSEHGTFLSRRSREAKTEGPDTALISTFTSAQERAVLRRALADKRLIIHVYPQGIPAAESLSAEQQLALEEKRLLLISPQPGGSPLNKKVATLCNEYVLRQAVEVWVGDISPNGMLASLLETLNQEVRA